MGLREMRLKYGDKKGEQLINDAIRAEIVGGNEILDAVYLAPQIRASCKGLPSEQLADKIFKLLVSARKKMVGEIVTRYQLKGTETK